MDALLARGAFLHGEGSSGETPILIAAYANNVAAVHSLIGRGARADVPSMEGHSLAWCCLAISEEPEARLLLCDVIAKNAKVLSTKFAPFSRTLLHKAVLSLRDEALMEAVTTLHALGVSLDDTDELGKTALHYAAALGHTNVVHALLEAGAAVDPVDGAGNTPLLLALLPATAEALLTRGADASHINRHGFTLLHVACAFGILELRVS